MRRLRNVLIILGAGIFLVSSSIGVIADAETDSTDDVYHYSFSEAGFSWKVSVEDKPNIDITEVSFSVSDDKLTLMLKVDGNIQSSENAGYWAFFNSSDSAYMMSWNNGQGYGLAMSIDQEDGSFDFDPEITASGATLTAVFDVIGNTDNAGLWGWAAEYTVYGDQTNEWWGDWVPGAYAPFWDEDIEDDTEENGEDDGMDTGDKDSDGGTPGFELIVIICAIALVLFLNRKKQV